MKHLDLLFSAIKSPYGVEVETSNPTRLRAELYADVREAKTKGDDTFSKLSFHLCPFDPQTKLWLAHKADTQADIQTPTETPNGDQT